MTEIADVTWLAGLLEGEGCFGSYPAGKGSRHRNPQVALWMCDEDVVVRAMTIGNSLVGGSAATYRRKELQAKAEWKPQFGYVWSGRRAIDLIWALVPYMGARRTARCVEVVTEWYESRFQHCVRCGSAFWAETKIRKLCSEECQKASHKDAVQKFARKTM